MPEKSARLNLAEAVKLASVEHVLFQFAADCANVGITPSRASESHEDLNRKSKRVSSVRITLLFWFLILNESYFFALSSFSKGLSFIPLFWWIKE